MREESTVRTHVTLDGLLDVDSLQKLLLVLLVLLLHLHCTCTCTCRLGRLAGRRQDAPYNPSKTCTEVCLCHRRVSGGRSTDDVPTWTFTINELSSRAETLT